MVKESANFELPVSKEAVEHGLRIGKKICIEKFERTMATPSPSKLQADVYGFIAQTVVCEYLKQPFPDFDTKGDWYDVKLKGLRVDVKKVGADPATKKPLVTINMKQFYRKQHRVDAFLFCSFTKGDMDVEGIRVPMPGFSKLWLLGWLPVGHVEMKGKKYVWPNGDVSFQFDTKDLRNVGDLL